MKENTEYRSVQDPIRVLHEEYTIACSWHVSSLTQETQHLSNNGHTLVVMYCSTRRRLFFQMRSDMAQTSIQPTACILVIFKLHGKQ